MKFLRLVILFLISQCAMNIAYAACEGIYPNSAMEGSNNGQLQLDLQQALQSKRTDGLQRDLDEINRILSNPGISGNPTANTFYSCFAQAYTDAIKQVLNSRSSGSANENSSAANKNVHSKVTEGCLSVGNNTGMAASAYNRCSFPVNYQYCLVSSGGGLFSCHEQKFGGGNTVPPGGSDGFSTMGAGSRWKVYFAECDASQSQNTPAHLRFLGKRITGTCD